MRRVDGSGGEENFTASTEFQLPNSVSPDGKLLAYCVGTATQSFLRELSLQGDHKPQSLLPGPGNRAAAAFSPNGRWIAYVSDESGENEVYVQVSTGQGAKWQISSGGGTEPSWAHDGRELFYRAGNKMIAAEVQSGATFSPAKPRELFEGDYKYPSGFILDLIPDYDVSPDGQEFLMVQPVVPVTAVPPPTRGLPVVLNWFPDLRRAARRGSDEQGPQWGDEAAVSFALASAYGGEFAFGRSTVPSAPRARTMVVSWPALLKRQ